MTAQPDYKPHERSPLAPCPMDRNVVFVKSDCGCTIEGCGHLPDPVRPKLCAKHAAAPDLYAALQRMIELVQHADSKDPHTPWCNGVHEGTSCEGDYIAAGIIDEARAALRKADGNAR